MLQGEEEDEGQLCKNLLLYYFFVYYLNFYIFFSHKLMYKLFVISM